MVASGHETERFRRVPADNLKVKRALPAAVAVILATTSGCSTFGSSRGLYEIDQSRSAVRAARSWHMEGRSRTRDGRFWNTHVREVVCPVDFMTSDTQTDANGQQRTVKAVVLDGILYSDHGGGWLRGRTGGREDIAPDCQYGPMLPSKTPLFSDMDDLLRNATVRKLDVSRVGGDSCREYEVSLPTSAGPVPRYSLCIHESDRLPRRITFADGSAQFEFSRWNATTIVAPGG